MLIQEGFADDGRLNLYLAVSLYIIHLFKKIKKMYVDFIQIKRMK